MIHHKISRIFLAVVIGSATTIAVAQTYNSVWNNEAFAAPRSPSISPSAVDNVASTNVYAPIVAPTNVLDDVPRDASGKHASISCNSNGTAVRLMSAECLRLMKITATLE